MSTSSLIIIGNYTHLHVSVIFASNICKFSLYYYHANLLSYLLDSPWSSTQAVPARKSNGAFQPHFFRNQVYVIKKAVLPCHFPPACFRSSWPMNIAFWRFNAFPYFQNLG